MANHSNCVPGGKAAQSLRTPERKSEIARQGGLAGSRCQCLRCTPERRSAIGRMGGVISQALKTAEERKESARHAANARWKR